MSRTVIVIIAVAVIAVAGAAAVVLLSGGTGSEDPVGPEFVPDTTMKVQSGERTTVPFSLSPVKGVTAGSVTVTVSGADIQDAEWTIDAFLTHYGLDGSTDGVFLYQEPTDIGGEVFDVDVIVPGKSVAYIKADFSLRDSGNNILSKQTWTVALDPTNNQGVA